jgi:hypothetical protein
MAVPVQAKKFMRSCLNEKKQKQKKKKKNTGMVADICYPNYYRKPKI